MQGTQGGWLGLAALNLTNNSLTGTLPVDWATDAAMPVLQVLSSTPNCHWQQHEHGCL